MKRWPAWVVGIAVVISVGLAVRGYVKLEAKKRRDAAYESILTAYRQDLKPGMTRKQVEDYLQAKGARFTQLCCLQQQTLADLVEIGQEDALWYCSESQVNIAFDFAAPNSHDSLKAFDTDVLKSITIFRQFGGCL